MKPKNAPKQTPSAARRGPDWLDWEDAVLRHCRTIEILAALLAHTGCNDGRNDGLTLDVVNETGDMIKTEAVGLKQRLKARPGRGAK